MTSTILIFGGSGFIGRSLTNELLQQNHKITVVCQNPNKTKITPHKNLAITSLDIFAQEKVQEICAKHNCVINLIGKLYEEKVNDFSKFHKEFPQILANSLDKQQQLIHISALGIVAASASSCYAGSKLAGEHAICTTKAQHTIIRPSIVFGQNDNFFNLFANIARFSPILPLIGGGRTLFSPVYVEDLTKAIATLIQKPSNTKLFAAVGPDTASFKELLNFILHTTHKKRILMPLPSSIAKLQAHLMHAARLFLLTPDQVELLKYNNTNEELANIDSLQIKLHSYKDIVPTYLGR